MHSTQNYRQTTYHIYLDQYNYCLVDTQESYIEYTHTVFIIFIVAILYHSLTIYHNIKSFVISSSTLQYMELSFIYT